VKTNVGMVLCSCQREDKIRRRVPPRYYSARLEDFGTEIQRRVLSWLSDCGDGLFLTGPAGVGKTRLCAAIVRWRIEHDKKAIFKRCADFYAELRAAIQTETSENLVMDPLSVAPLLVFDDLGSGSLSDHERRFTLEVLDRRVNAIRPTVVTSNWSLEKIGDLMDERIASRLAAFAALELQGRDRRLRK
jgi:DNA replication protein DnaC